MRSLFKVTFDTKVAGRWLGGGNGFASTNIVTRGDGLAAAERVVRLELRNEYDGRRPTAVRVMRVELVAHDIAT